jgi:cytochrome c peroxidase
MVRIRAALSGSTALGLATVLAIAAGAACGDDSARSTAAPAADAGNDAAPLCLDGVPTGPYPPGPYELGVLGTAPPDLAFEGPDGTVRIADFYEPCAERSRILVVRSAAEWCGPCLWHVAHTKRFMDDPRFAGRLVLLDLLIADADNMPAKVADVARWRKKIDAPGLIAVDPDYRLGPALLARSPLPEYVFIDTRTMRILGTMSDPNPESLVGRIAVELADLDGTPRPPLPSPTLIDGYFTENEMDLIRGMKLDPVPPPDPTNEYSNLPAAVALGRALFSDAELSPSGNVSCAKCHDPGLDLGDGVPQSTGVAKVDRNSPGVALSAHSRWQFWDGRADTLWAQALGPFEDAREFGGSRLFVAHQIAQRYADQYTAVFGAKYPLPDMSALPRNGKPGDPEWDGLSAEQKDAVTRVFVNVGKAIAAFERAMRVKPNAIDRYAEGDTSALTKGQKIALSLFMKNGCIQCHWGPRLTDDAFHVLRFATGRQDGKADEGRAAGLVKLAASEFLASSKWSDAPAAAKPFLVDAPTMLGAFKTPTLRGVPTSAPYGHGGTLSSLIDVTKHYGSRGLEHADPRAVGTTEQWVPNFDDNVARDLVPILEAMGAVIELP